MLCGFAVHGSRSWLCHQCAMEDKCLASLVAMRLADAPQAQPRSTRVLAVHLYSVIYTRMVGDGAAAAAVRHRQAGRLWSCWRTAGLDVPQSVPPQHGGRAHTPQGPRTYLRFYNIYRYIYIVHVYVCMYVCTSMSAPRLRVRRLWETAGLDVARSVRSMCTHRRGPARTLGFIIYIYVYI